MPHWGVAVALVPPSSTASIAFLGFDVTTWGIIAILGWLLALALGSLVGLRLLLPDLRPRAARDGSEQDEGLEPPDLLRIVAPGEEPASGVLDWIASATEADAVAFLELAPGAGERLRVAPRGLDSDSISSLAALARRALVDTEAEQGALGDVRPVRWLGVGGTKVLIAVGVDDEAEEPLRFGRYLLEWLGASRRERPRADLEDRLRWIKGMAWVEVDERRARLLLGEKADLAAVKREVDRVLDATDVRPEWIAEGAPPPSEGLVILEREPGVEPVGSSPGVRQTDEELAGVPSRGEARVRLTDVMVSENGRATVDVRIRWKDQEIRGRGHGALTGPGRTFAAAQAVADAIRPLLRNDITVERLYTAAMKEGGSVLIAEVVMEGIRYVGAVVERQDQRDWTGARAVLDAVNRRLTQVAGRSGRV